MYTDDMRKTSRQEINLLRCSTYSTSKTTSSSPTHGFIRHFSSNRLLIYLLWFCGSALCSLRGSNSSS